MNIIALVSNTLSSAVIFVFGVSCIVVGWLIVGIELYHLSMHYHEFQATPFIAGGLFMTAGGVIVQTGSVLKAIQFLMDIRRGGRRKFDPPSK